MGKRSRALDPATVAALREHAAQQAEERALIGAGYVDSGWCSPVRMAGRCIPT
jgi:hypothetical protein